MYMYMYVCMYTYMYMYMYVYDMCMYMYMHMFAHMYTYMYMYMYMYTYMFRYLCLGMALAIPKSQKDIFRRGYIYISYFIAVSPSILNTFYNFSKHEFQNDILGQGIYLWEGGRYLYLDLDMDMDTWEQCHNHPVSSQMVRINKIPRHVRFLPPGDAGRLFRVDNFTAFLAMLFQDHYP